MSLFGILKNKIGCENTVFAKPSVDKAADVRERKILNDITNQTNALLSQKKHVVVPQKPSANIPIPGIPESAAAMEVDRPYMARKVDDIDRYDHDDPQSASEYANEMFELFKHDEKKYAISSTYMTMQSSVTSKMRACLINWMVRTVCVLCVFH